MGTPMAMIRQPVPGIGQNLTKMASHGDRETANNNERQQQWKVASCVLFAATSCFVKGGRVRNILYY